MTLRPALSSIDQRMMGKRVVIEVTLTAGHGRFVGRSEGDGDPAHRFRLVGEATLKAVKALVPEMQLDLNAVGTSDLGQLRIALAQVRENGRDLVGSALILGGDPVVATAKAVLDALNRRLARA
ncbi:MAG TPA: hypothetical protein VLA54_11640 [Acidimicrobiia bacterium]|jgi:hypothetical protein|nr:hypothetical protein [Acidimicrobiia bacterium]